MISLDLYFGFQVLGFVESHAGNTSLSSDEVTSRNILWLSVCFLALHRDGSVGKPGLVTCLNYCKRHTLTHVDCAFPSEATPSST